MPEYILSLDQGTTSSRAMLFDRAGNIAGSAQREIAQIFPDKAAGWVEHDPYDILNSQLRAATEVLARSAAGARDVVALGLANQRETTIVWDRNTGKPIYNAIVWQDRRTAEVCSKLIEAGAEEDVRRRTGLRLDPYFSATKIGWILDHVAGARSAASRGELAFGTVDSWLIWNLTKGKLHVTDRTNASRTLLYNIVEDCWDDEMLRLFGVPHSMLPGVVPSSGSLGTASARSGMPAIEMAGVAGDQQAALFGQMCVAPGDAKNTYGTGCFLLQHIGSAFRLSEHRLLTTLACSLDQTPQFALEGSIFVGGAVVQWLRDQMKFFVESAEVEALAQTVESSAGVVLVPAFTGLGAPHWDPDATGLLIGLGRGTQRGHIARAALESIALQVSDVLRAMDADTPTALRALRVDGGAASNDLLMQCQADLLGVPVMRPSCIETTALGAAYLAGLAVGYWADLDEIRSALPAPTTFTPRGERRWAEELSERWAEAIQRAKGWNVRL